MYRLSEIGYDINNMHMASYDWRLSFKDLERRDRFWTRLRFQIEALVQMNHARAVILAHSMGYVNDCLSMFDQNCLVCCCVFYGVRACRRRIKRAQDADVDMEETVVLQLRSQSTRSQFPARLTSIHCHEARGWAFSNSFSECTKPIGTSHLGQLPSLCSLC